MRQTKIDHVNLFKKWHARDVLLYSSKEGCQRNRASRDAPRPAQRQELTESVNRNQDMFSSEPGHTNLGQHHIITEPGKTVELRPYPLPEARRDAVRTEEKTMLSSRNRTMSGAAP